MIVQVEGNIGAGKSYLCRQLCDSGLGYLAEERIDSAFLSLFYDNPQKYAFAFQLHTAENRLSMHKSIVDDVPSVVIDRGLFGDFVFATTAYRVGCISHEELAVYHSLLARRGNSRVTPDVLLYLRTSPQVCASRIKVRGRPQESGIDQAYLSMLHNTHDELLKQWQEGKLTPFLGQYPKRVITKEWDHFGDVDDLVESLSKSNMF